jgi:hypothetical protein
MLITPKIFFCHILIVQTAEMELKKKKKPLCDVKQGILEQKKYL